MIDPVAAEVTSKINANDLLDYAEGTVINTML